jgi:hypothetical protein
MLMTTSFRRILMTTLATAALLVLSVAASGAASAASGIHVVADTHGGNGNGGNGNGNGGNGNGGNGNGGGQGTATPELPSGVLFSLGLVPLAAGVYLVWRRRQTDTA